MVDDRKAKAAEVTEKLFGVATAGGETDDPFYNPALEHLFGEIWSRPGFALRDRSLVTIAALAVLGRTEQFRFHLHGALNVGITPTEIEEMLVHLAYYGGFPVAAMSRPIVAEVLAARADAP